MSPLLEQIVVSAITALVTTTALLLVLPKERDR